VIHGSRRTWSCTRCAGWSTREAGCSTAEDHYGLAGLTDLAISAGFRPEWIATGSLEEWDDFESGYMADVEEWLADHQDHPQAAETRKRADDHLSIWLRGSRGCMGLAYLTLIPVP
jgi:hypothetical protein